MLSDAGLPDGVCNVVTGIGAEAGQALVTHPLVNHITFTGSVATGQAVMRAAADNVTRLVLELGGKSPVVVMADCDLDAATDGIIGAIYENAGQICSAGSRLVVEASIHDALVERLCRRAEALRLGHGLTDPQVGPINSAQQLSRVAGFIDRARERGVEMATGGEATTDPQTGTGWFYRPTIAVGPGVDDELIQQEVFGPVLCVQKADGAEHALALANATDYALVAGIYTRDFGLAHRLARRIDAGQVFINEYFAGGIEVPFGGNRKSGFGREKGLEGLLGYCRTKSVAGRIA